ncbi:MAG: hybrid sensor histidine kinase/response regulator [Anaerolineae bacterium]
MITDERETDALAGSILVVDDTPNNLRLLTQLLRRQGYRVRVAEDGSRAIESALANPPDLILLDIRMPGMDGYEVCKSLKGKPKTSEIPVIFISALDTTDDKVNAFTAGGVDYITKPLEPDEVLARVKTHLALQNASRRLQEKTKQLQDVNDELAREIVERKAEIVARAQAEAKLQQYAQELEARNAELDAFAHTVAHDLKNPLTTAINYLLVMEMGYGTMPFEEVQQYLHATSLAAWDMNNIISELLLLASVRRMEQVETKPIQMQSVVEQAQERLAAAIDQSHARIKTPASWPAVTSYAPWLVEVWANYLSNAIKYGGTPPEIELGFEEPAPADHHAAEDIRFWVRDNGNGLTPENQARLFTEFTRVGESPIGGHGLGLSIVRRIVERLHGQVGVESQVGKGSLFWFTLPRAGS